MQNFKKRKARSSQATFRKRSGHALADGEEEAVDKTTMPTVLKTNVHLHTDDSWGNEDDEDGINISSYLSRSKALASKRVKRVSADVARFGTIKPNVQFQGINRGEAPPEDTMVLSDALTFTSMVGTSYTSKNYVKEDSISGTRYDELTDKERSAFTKLKKPLDLSNSVEFASSVAVAPNDSLGNKEIDVNDRTVCDKGLPVSAETSFNQATDPTSAKGFCANDKSLSVADTLTFLRQAGDFATIKKDIIVGRPKDKKFINPNPLSKPGTKEIVLEYRDEQGRLLTPKEAFRQLSYKFHGIEPSKRTQEKRSRQRQERGQHQLCE